MAIDVRVVDRDNSREYTIYRALITHIASHGTIGGGTTVRILAYRDGLPCGAMAISTSHINLSWLEKKLGYRLAAYLAHVVLCRDRECLKAMMARAEEEARRAGAKALVAIGSAAPKLEEDLKALGFEYEELAGRRLLAKRLELFEG